MPIVAMLRVSNEQLHLRVLILLPLSPLLKIPGERLIIGLAMGASRSIGSIETNTRA